MGEDLLLAYRELIRDEARLGEKLAKRGLRVGVPIADQWSVLHDYLHLYAEGTSPAGMVVFGGAPDEGSRHTGIPFTGAPEASAMGLGARGQDASPAGAPFWGAVDRARRSAGEAPLESFFGTVHLTHAVPFDVHGGVLTPEALDVSASHVLRILGALRPQAAVAVGADALAALARALRHHDLAQLAEAPETSWATRWPPTTPLRAYPYVEVPIPRPFRMRIVPVPSLVGPHFGWAEQTLGSVFAYALA